MTHLLTTAEAAERLGISVSELTAWRWQRRGPKFVRHGGSIRYPEDAVVAWLTQPRR
jgi:excisionase family DNA binding protein